jgi:iron uptake system component EfeO
MESLVMISLCRSPRALARAAASAIVVSAAVVACGGGSAGSPGPSTPAPSGVVPVEAKEYSFGPAAITVPAGTVTFQVRNAGNEEHEFEIFQGETVVDEIEGLVPGLTKPLTVTLAAGTYTFKCLLNGHDQLGMTGTLTVQ